MNEIVTGWTQQRTKHEAMAQLSGVGVPAGAVLDSMELTNEPSFRERGNPANDDARGTQDDDAHLARTVLMACRPR